MVAYFENFGGAHAESRLSLYLARQWRKYLDQSQHDWDELELFAQILEDGARSHGCGWQELAMNVRGWLSELQLLSK